jgi:predicted nuclease of predicted toxin-antitoxin system
MVLQQAGHDVATVHEQHLNGAPDEQVFEVCRVEGRCLVTLDLDFTNPLRFDLANGPGVCVVRYASHAVRESTLAAARTLADALTKRDVSGRLWIVSRDRIRTYDADDGDI